MGRWTNLSQKVCIVASDEERLIKHCPDLDRWPESWSIEPADIVYGEQMLEHLKPFLLDLLGSGLSRKTFRTHRDNLWLLGGEMIADMQRDPDGRRDVEAWLDQALDGEDGPFMREQISERVQDSFDLTCRRFYRFRQRHRSDTK